MSFQLIIAPSAERDLERLEDKVSKEIRRYLEGPLRRDPYRAGKPLGVRDPADPKGRERQGITPAPAPRVPVREEEIPSATMFEANENSWRVLYRIDRNTRTVRVTVISYRPRSGRRFGEPEPRMPFVQRFR